MAVSTANEHNLDTANGEIKMNAPFGTFVYNFVAMNTTKYASMRMRMRMFMTWANLLFMSSNTIFKCVTHKSHIVYRFISAFTFISDFCWSVQRFCRLCTLRCSLFFPPAKKKPFNASECVRVLSPSKTGHAQCEYCWKIYKQTSRRE